MGRPVNKRYFGTSGSNIKVRFKTGGTEYNGYVVKQTGSKRFKVTDGSGHTITGYLVNKSNGALDNGDVVINVLTDAGAYEQVIKIFNRTVITETGTRRGWTFTASESDSLAQMTEEAGPTITFLTQPTSTTLDLSDSASDQVTFTIDITGVPTSGTTYQWKVSTDGGSSYSNVSTGTGGTTTSYTIAAQTDTSANGYKYKCTVTNSTAANSPVDSSVATLTVQA